MLTQKQNGTDRVVSYFSAKLTPTQQRYMTTEKECLAVILSIEKFRHYIDGLYVPNDRKRWSNATMKKPQSMVDFSKRDIVLDKNIIGLKWTMIFGDMWVIAKHAKRPNTRIIISVHQWEKTARQRSHGKS